MDREYVKQLAKAAIAQQLNLWAALASLEIELDQFDGVADLLENYCAGLHGGMEYLDDSTLNRLTDELEQLCSAAEPINE